MELRPYDGDRDAEALWALKRGFERGLGAGTGGDEKQAKYEGKLTGEYRDRYLEWVDRCTLRDDRCVTVAEADSVNGDGDGADGGLVGYVFVLPETMAMVWDAAVLNEVYVREPYRGTGVADDLLDAAVAVARGQDLPLSRLVLDVDPENARARAFYDRHGFEPWGEMVAKSL